MGMLSAIANTTKFVQRQLGREILKYHQKLKFCCFSKKTTSICRGDTKACPCCLDFQYKNFSYAFFIGKKWPLYVNFNIPLFVKWHFSQHISCGYEICWHVSNSSRNKNLKSQFMSTLENGFFGPQNFVVLLEH
jgi:hypothetical protein